MWNAENKVTDVTGVGVGVGDGVDAGAGAVVGLSGKCFDDACSSTADRQRTCESE
ncbi:hypothetical protein ACGF5O_00120 [Streptomyces sp. NPDC048291]|uniref:hypothetical protein n=1 Tax=Streptomyces sp. NPDC048291 TaxID=3365530 RepID=UPI0037239CCE